jgi:hypothetical protein
MTVTASAHNERLSVLDLRRSASIDLNARRFCQMETVLYIMSRTIICTVVWHLRFSHRWSCRWSFFACNVVWRFGGIYCFLLYGWRRRQYVCSSKTFVCTDQSIRWNNTEDQNQHIICSILLTTKYFIIVFWDVLPCKIIADRRFRGSSRMMEAARTSETSVDKYFTRQYIPEYSSEHHTRRRENLKSHTKFLFGNPR